MASTSSSAAAPPVKKHDVFVSFRGVDTRDGFTSHLRAALERENIDTFIDDRLEQGDEIKPSLLRTIENSTISVVIFSARYADSRWCLEELVKMLECRGNGEGQVVIPVFYHVQPTHVRFLTGPFGKGLAKREKRYGKEMLQRWGDALRKAADLSGFDSDAIKPEAVLVEKIVQRILGILNLTSSNYINKDLFGVDSSIKEIESLLHIGSTENLRILGIWGMGGIGKTTIARAVFNKIKNKFSSYYFASNVREESENSNELRALREKLLCGILRDPNADINSSLIYQKLCSKKVLIVLDDLTSLKQIECLIGGSIRYFGSGSRIIMTTRDKRVLKSYKLHVNNIYIYKVEGLFQKDALELFCWYAFGEKCPSSDYISLSEKIVEYAQGVPLALKELGQFLCTRSRGAWVSAINKIQRIPRPEIQEVLKLSYDGLDDNQKIIFLDIACFFRWENRDQVIKFLVANGLETEIGIDDLIDKCLITISNNKIIMNDLLQIMGWEIVRCQPSTNPGEHRRLCYHRDIHDVLQNTVLNTETKNIRGICLDMSEVNDIHLTSNPFPNMENLRLLKLHNSQSEQRSLNKVHNVRGFQSVVELRYLCWHGCPLMTLQSSFCSRNLVVLDMSHSKVKELRIDDQHFHSLKHINLSHSKHLDKITDLSLAPNLETLIFEGCISLVDISPSIECLNKLVMLNLRHCKSLESLPNIWKLASLEDLHLFGCLKLDQSVINDKITDMVHKLEHPESRSSQTRCICFPGTEIHHEWLTCQYPGSSVSLKRPDDWLNRKFVSLALCAIVDYGNYRCGEEGLKVGYDFKHGSVIFHRGTLRSWDSGAGPCCVDSDHAFLCFDFHVPVPASNNPYNNEMTIQFYVEDLKGEPLGCCAVKKCGFRSMDYQVVENSAAGAVYLEEEDEEIIEISSMFKTSWPA